MKKHIITIAILSLIICFSSCYRDIDLEQYRSEPKIVLNSVISPEIEVMASVSKTIFYTDTKNPDVNIKDADVELYINNEFVEKMLWVEDNNLVNKGIYKSNTKPTEGDIVKIVVNSSLGTAWAEDVIPPKIEIKDIKLTYRVMDNPNSILVNIGGEMVKMKDYEIKYHITFTDNAEEKNYYCIKIENTDDNQPLGLLDYSLDPVFKVQQPVIDGASTNKLIEGQGGRTFSDDIINGNTYTMVIRETKNSYTYEHGENMYRRISLISISKAYYNYLTALLNISDNKVSQKLDEWGLAEPTPFYSNIDGGVGIMGSAQNDFRLIDLREILPEYGE